MKIKSEEIVFKNQCFSAQWGGGISYHLALAAALQKFCTKLQVLFPQGMNFEELKTKIPKTFIVGVWSHYRKNRRFPVWSELKDAWNERSKAVVVCHSNAIPSYSLNTKAYLQVDFPDKVDLRWMDRLRLNSYKGIICNSEFTAGWIKEYWDKQAQVLYPPVVPIPGLPKKQIIISTGRFVKPGFGRSKRQDVLIEAFKNLGKSAKDWELHLAGYIQDLDYKATLEEAVKGYPIFLHFNILRTELEQMLGEASIYWHAVGFDNDEKTQPNAMEHFGISTVEAMSTGCIPVVINKGGQREIVQHQTSGYLWDTLEELQKYSLNLMDNQELRQQVARETEKRFQLFSFETFQQEVKHYFNIKNHE